jgi:hypothetical protein
MMVRPQAGRRHCLGCVPIPDYNVVRVRDRENIEALKICMLDLTVIVVNECMNEPKNWLFPPISG